jgi:hypothetical protein
MLSEGENTGVLKKTGKCGSQKQNKMCRGGGGDEFCQMLLASGIR